nr:hypothetical protein [Tanacetum cinerariifolium]
RKGRRPALSISKMKAAYYPDAGLEKMVSDPLPLGVHLVKSQSNPTSSSTKIWNI